MASFDDEKAMGLTGVGTRVGEERTWSYRTTSGVRLKCRDEVLGPQGTFPEGAK